MVISIDCGKLTKDEIHELDCEAYAVFSKVYYMDPEPMYQITKKKGITYLLCENGFEKYWRERRIIL